MLEWILAAIWAGYTWSEFNKLDGNDQSIIVAAYRCEQQVKAVLDNEQAKEIKRQRRKPRGKHG